MNIDSKATMAAIIGAILIIGASSSSTSLLRATPPGDSCSLLTEAQVSGVLGVSVGAGQHVGGASLCGWSQPSDTSHTGKRVVLDLFGPMGSLTPADRFTTAKTPVKGITKTPVGGIGDDAYFITTPGIGTGLNVKKGSSVFQIRVYGFSIDQVEAMEKTLAQDALAKL
jgi:hypothetical protein